MSSPSGIDVLMDLETGDLPAFTRIVAGIEIVAQRVVARLLTHLGDWPLDTGVGVDWKGFLGEKPANVDAFAAKLAVEVLDTKGVSNVQDIENSQSDGLASITMKVITQDGDFDVLITPQDRVGNPSVVVGGILGHSGTVSP